MTHFVMCSRHHLTSIQGSPVSGPVLDLCSLGSSASRHSEHGQLCGFCFRGAAFHSAPGGRQPGDFGSGRGSDHPVEFSG